jgi:hypothetical protein
MEPGALLSEEQLLRMSGPVGGPEPGELLAEGPQSVLGPGLKEKTILAQVWSGLQPGTRSTACKRLNGPDPRLKWTIFAQVRPNLRPGPGALCAEGLHGPDPRLN